jgi:TP901 family phage tail tape measure protein
MAERLAYLEAVVGADVTQFRKGMRDIRNEVGFLSETVRGLTGIGRSLTLAYTTPVLALGTAAINTASQFEASMYNINAIAGLTATELDNLSARTLAFGSNTRAGANAASEALYTVFSAGLTEVEQAFSAMEVSTYTAEAGLADMTTTTETLIAVMLSYGDTSEEMAWRTSDALTQMVAVGVGSMQEFSTSLSSVIPTASAAGMGFDELAADMAFLTQRGLSASRAGVSLNAAIEQMVNPTQAMSSAFSELGARGLPDLVEQFGSVNGAIEALIRTADGDLTTLYEMFNSRQARRAVGLFATDLEGWGDAIDEFYGSIDGATMRAWEQQMTSFSASWDLLTSAVEGAGIAIGQTMFPVLQPLVDGVTELILAVTNASPELLAMGTAFVAVTAAIPPLMWLIGSLISPFGVLAGAVAAVGVAFSTNFMGIATTVQTQVSNILGHLNPLKNTLQDFWDTVFPTVEDIIPDFSGQNATIPDPFDVISVTQPTSLWEIYEREGYSELFSWQEFMDRALESGWQGGAITPDTGFTLDLSGTGVTGLQETVDKSLELLEINPEEVGSLNIWDRIVIGFNNAFPEIQNHLSVLWNTFTGWIDDVGSNIINGMAGWFNLGNGTQFYVALYELLHGNLVAAVNTVFPNMGTNIANALSGLDLGSAFPQITSAIGNLFTNVSSWLVTTGIPLLSQASGLIIGRIGIVLGNMIKAGMESVNVGSFGNFIQNNIINPFIQGLEDAGVDLSPLGDAMTSIGDGIGNIYDTLTSFAEMTGLDDTWDMLANIGTVIGDFMTDLSQADTSGLVKLGLIIAMLGGATFTTMVGFINGIGNTFATVLEAVGDAIVFFVEGLASAGNGDISGVITNMSAALINLGFAILQVPVGIIDSITESINNLLGLDIPSLNNMVNDLRNSINDAFTGDGTQLGQGEPIDLTPEFTFNNNPVWGEGMTTREFNMAWEGLPVSMSLDDTDITPVYNGDGSLTGLEFPEQITWDDDMIDFVVDVRNLRMGLTEEEVSIGNMLYDALTEALAGSDQDILDAIIYDGTLPVEGNMTIELMDTSIFDVLPPSGGLIVTDDLILTADSSTITTSTDPTLQEGDDTVPTVTIPEVNLEPLAVSFADDLIGGASSEDIIADLLPIQEAWTTMFSAEGSMATTFATFSANTVLGWDNVGTAINSVTTKLNTEIPPAITLFVGQSDIMNGALAKVTGNVQSASAAIGSLRREIAQLMALDSELSVNVEVSGSINKDGSHKTGLGFVPYDGYMAELHRGEQVLTAEEARDYREPVAKEIVTSNANSGSTTINNHEVTINGIQDVDELLIELQRRGIEFN